MMKLILCEKPSVAKVFAKALNAEFKNGYHVNIKAGYCIVNAVGHLLTLYDPEDYAVHLKDWDIRNLPIVPNKFMHKVPSGQDDGYKIKQLNIIKKAINDNEITDFIIATDAGREGELIARLILTEVIKPFTHEMTFKRLWTSKALTSEIVLEELKNLKPLADYDKIYEQALARSQTDWLYGMNYTRLLTKIFGDFFTFGRVQTALLKIVFDRDELINSFKKAYFFENKFELENITFSFKHPIQNDYTTTQEEREANAKEIEILVNSQQQKFVDIEKKVESKKPPLLLNLNALSQKTNKLWGYSAKFTLSLAQELYEKHKCLTYPRTPSRHLNESDLEFFMTCLKDLGLNGSTVSTGNKNIFDSSKVEDHHALLISAKKPAGLSIDETNIYDLIFSSMKMIISNNYEFQNIKSSVRFGEDIIFSNTTNQTIYLGWKEFEITKKARVQEVLFTLEEKQLYPVLKNRIEKKETEKPSLYSEADLLKLMDKYGLGTSATQANHLSSIVEEKRGYAHVEKAKFVIDEKGILFISKIQTNEILAKTIEPQNTARFEQSLLAETPEIIFEKFKSDFIKVKDIFVKNQAFLHIGKPVFQKKSLGSCPNCGAQVFEGKNNFYCEKSTKENPCFSFPKSFLGATITAKDISQVVAGQKTTIKKMLSKKTKKLFSAQLEFKEGKINFIFKESK